jgi:hypothetical protein
MTPGPTIIRKCSACSKPIAQHTIGSGNTFGATYWTDGKREAPMLPDQPSLVMCPRCHAPVWIYELDQLGEVEPCASSRCRFKDAIEYGTPSFDDYLAVLSGGRTIPEQERYVRLRAWWAGNDPRRNGTREMPLSSREASNLTAFATLLDDSDLHDIVMKAEVMRELGRFDEARMLLGKSIDDRMSQAVAIINALCDKGDPYVTEMHFR